MSTTKLSRWLTKMPIVSILRGVTPDEVLDVAAAIREAGIGIIEVPFNSPNPTVSIEKLVNAIGDEAVVGAGTVLTVDDVQRVADAGGEITVSPNTDTAVIEKSLTHGMTPMPGFASLSEAFAAYQAGARHLKLFPASTYGVGHIRAASAVLPADAQVLAVGGIGANEMAEWLQAGVNGFGIGSDIFKPGFSPEKVHARALELVTALNQSRASLAQS